jgi:hypothetical protein
MCPRDQKKMERFAASHEDALEHMPLDAATVGREFGQPPRVMSVRTRCVVPPHVEPFGAFRRRNDKCDLDIPINQMCATHQVRRCLQLCSTVLSFEDDSEFLGATGWRRSCINTAVCRCFFVTGSR